MRPFNFVAPRTLDDALQTMTEPREGPGAFLLVDNGCKRNFAVR